MNLEDLHGSFATRAGLSLSRHGPSIVCDGRFYQVFMFAEEDHAEMFCEQFGGERMLPSERGKGAR
jgi:hypothetical protein